VAITTVCSKTIETSATIATIVTAKTAPLLGPAASCDSVEEAAGTNAASTSHSQRHGRGRASSHVIATPSTTTLPRAIGTQWPSESTAEATIAGGVSTA
jgi:hypothetical protein